MNHCYLFSLDIVPPLMENEVSIVRKRCSFSKSKIVIVGNKVEILLDPTRSRK